ncbi:uncharacterized protein LOC143199007 [Rhynchophorus ferrugineus]|uniref:uncharacterized protein LOC143199007 n=1 Tax=Rhynchophorus ferrugineus TaxID=354439 RepID=UPI003FCEE092
MYPLRSYMNRFFFGMIVTQRCSERSPLICRNNSNQTKQHLEDIVRDNAGHFCCEINLFDIANTSEKNLDKDSNIVSCQNSCRRPPVVRSPAALTNSRVLVEK